MPEPPSRSTRRALPKLHRWSGRDWWLFGTAVVTLGIARVALWVVPFHRVGRYLDTHGPATAPTGGATALGAEDFHVHTREVARAIARGSRLVPHATCLVQAIAAKAMLSRAGCAAIVWIGVARPQEGFEAHAWVESGGEIVIGKHANKQYVPLTSFGHTR
jgi:hypothetical protein